MRRREISEETTPVDTLISDFQLPGWAKLIFVVSAPPPPSLVMTVPEEQQSPSGISYFTEGNIEVQGGEGPIQSPEQGSQHQANGFFPLHRATSSIMKY